MSAAILLREARQSWRGLLRRPGYLLLAVATLALGVATSTAVFALIDQALLRALPFPQADRLVTVGQAYDGGTNHAGPAYLARVRQMRAFESSGILRGWAMSANVAHGDEGQVVRALHADRGFLSTLGLPFAMGRNFSPEEDRPGGPEAVILSHAYWQQIGHGDASVVGSTLQVEGRPAQVVGVLSADFQWWEGFDIIQPMKLDPLSPNLEQNETIVARLKPGVSVQAASAEAEVAIGNLLLGSPVFARNLDELKQALRRYPPNALPIKSSLFASQSGNVLWMFLAAAGCVLLIAVINLAGLMLLRVLGRSHDQAVRLSLGASALRLSGPMLAEGVLVGALGGMAGLLLAWLMLKGFSGFVPPEWLRGDPPALAAGSVWFALACGVGCSSLAVLLGAWRARSLNLPAELVGGGRAGWSRSSGRLGRALVVAQVALAVVLLTGAALFIRTLNELSKVPLGIQSQAVSVFGLSPIKSRTATIQDAVRDTERIIARLQRIPGVRYAAAGSNPPVTTQLNWGLELPNGQEVSAQYRFTTPQGLQVYGIPVLSGRGIQASDTAGAEPVCLVSQAFAKTHLDGHALGKRITIGADNKRVVMRVVGVVGDVRHKGPSAPPSPIVYTPMAQLPEGFWKIVSGFGGLTYSIRMQPGMPIGQREVQRAIAEVAPGQPISELRSMDALVASTTDQQKLNLLLVGLFAALALLLASIGLYAVMATSVAARRHEFGVRAALGAPPLRLLRLVLVESSRQIGLGLAIGLAIALAGSRVLQGFLFGVGAADPTAIALVLGVLASTGALAALVPALRAARVPPMQALRS
ncbi:ADOP family duplicated permease [Pseudoxanthomonas composti]|uniref:FtsX-like permease family protein n=1 Tax=Pseudoxanthomonas composti TaxID=2137479 RepID=A0A4Q1JY31_9GAMM|nr:ADOP family duplicated permease [Pseudoxanthomonas composti]RXR07240.1 FtsX-like permease family protein [Pseudoxanthomonas composti]